MIDIKTLFGLKGIADDLDDVGYFILARPEDMGVPQRFGHPVIASRRQYKRGLERDQSFNVVLPFPTEHCHNPYQFYNARSRQLVPMPKPIPLVENHKIVAVETVELEQLPEIMSLVIEEGGITFFLPEISGAKKSIDVAVKIVESFKHHAHVGYQLDRHSGGEPRAGLLSFFHLQHCTSIFNNKKVDGLGMLYQIVLPDASAKQGSVCYVSTMAMIAANHLDNVFVIDGCHVRGEGGAPNGLIKHLKEKLSEGGDGQKAKLKSSGGMADIKFTATTSYTTWSSSNPSTSTF